MCVEPCVLALSYLIFTGQGLNKAALHDAISAPHTGSGVSCWQLAAVSRLRTEESSLKQREIARGPRTLWTNAGVGDGDHFPSDRRPHGCVSGSETKNYVATSICKCDEVGVLRPRPHLGPVLSFELTNVASLAVQALRWSGLPVWLSRQTGP